MNISALSADLAAAFGTGNDDLSLACRHTAYGSASGAGEVLVLLVHPLLPAAAELPLDRPPDLLQKSGVLRPALFQIPGKDPKQRPQHQHCGDKADDAGQERDLFRQHPYDIQQDRAPDGTQTQLIGAVAAIHEPAQSVAQTLKETHNSASISLRVSTQHVILAEKSEKVKRMAGKFTNSSKICIQ